MGNLVSECIKNIMGIQRNPRDQNYDPEDFQDEEDQEQWRQTLIYIGGALNNKFVKILKLVLKVYFFMEWICRNILKI